MPTIDLLTQHDAVAIMTTKITTDSEVARFGVPGTRTGFLPRSNSIGEGTRFPT